MFAVVYRWRLRDGHEESFTRGWEPVTRAICGSYGSRLHRGDDGTWVAHARWPDAAPRHRCDHAEAQDGRLRADAVAERSRPSP